MFIIIMKKLLDKWYLSETFRIILKHIQKFKKAQLYILGTSAAKLILFTRRLGNNDFRFGLISLIISKFRF